MPRDILRDESAKCKLPASRSAFRAILDIRPVLLAPPRIWTTFRDRLGGLAHSPSLNVSRLDADALGTTAS